MPTDITAPDPLIDSLVADLGPVTPRRRGREAWLLAALVVVESILFVLMRGMREDMPIAMLTAAFWWKAGSLALIAVLAAATTLVSLDPAVTTARRLTPMWTALAVVAAAALGLGWLIDAGSGGRDALIARLEWRDGLDCLVNVALLALPVVLALGILIHRGAPAQPARTALSAGIAAAGFAAFVFAFHCGHDDPLYVVVWYGGALGAIAGLARLILPRLTRW